MATVRAVVNTDQVNKQNIRVPLKELVASTEKHIAFSLQHRLPPGSPSFISHDVTRPAGWSSCPVIVLSRDMARQIAFIHLPETKTDEKALSEVSTAYSRSFSEQCRAGFEEELRGRLNSADLTEATADFSHCAILIRNGLASELYPEFFSLDSSKVDRDGLTYYDSLICDFTEMQPGIFHDPKRDVLIFAHRYFRRSLSGRNSLNQYFLRRLSDAIKESKPQARIRLDPDLVGHPGSLQHILEFEYWYGPKFSDEIHGIPSGATVYSADERTRFFEAIGKTHLWWKNPESRTVDGKEVSYRTFEAEELLEEPSAGLGDDGYGCRYVHAEYAVETGFISHFDGAIRAYPVVAFLERIEKNIDRAGKNSAYTKLFRLDGDIPVNVWKSLTVDFFRGNQLLPEYFGAAEEAVEGVPFESEAAAGADLVALIGFDRPESCPSLRVVADQSCPHNGELIDCIDFNKGACGRLISQLVDLSNASLLICQDKTINLPRIIVGVTEGLAARLADLSSKLADALSLDLGSGQLERASIALSWTDRGVMTTMSLAGKLDALVALLRCVPEIVKPEQPASTWVDNLDMKVKELAPMQSGKLDPSPLVTEDGRLSLSHRVDESIPAELAIPDSAREA